MTTSSILDLIIVFISILQVHPMRTHRNRYGGYSKCESVRYNEFFLDNAPFYREAVIQNLEKLAFAPSVQMQRKLYEIFGT